MKNVNKLFLEAYHDVEMAGFKPGVIVGVVVNSRAKKRWGLCKRQDDSFIIEISDRLLADELEDISPKNTLVHEILHTLPGCFNHGVEWQKAANVMNKRYPGYYISRTTSSASLGLEPIGRIRNDEIKYKCRCVGCNATWYYKRAGKVVQHPENYRCRRCHGQLELFEV